MTYFDRIATGRITGRFSYTSLGTDGWSVSSQTPDLLADVTTNAVANIERLPARGLGGVPELGDRQRRFAWVGARGSAWRFLINTVEAGNDSSARPNNNFSDCVVVSRSGEAEAGPRPTEFWDSHDWLNPYGPNEVAQADVRRLGQGLSIERDRSDESLLVFARMSAAHETADLFNTLATLVLAVGAAAGQATSVRMDSTVLAQLALDAALSLAPAATVWERTFEVRTSPPPPTTNTDLVLFTAEDDDGISPTGLVDLRGTCPQPDTEAQPCPSCGRETLDWAALVARVLIGLGRLMEGQHDTGQATAAATELLDAVAAANRDGVPPERFAQALHPEKLGRTALVQIMDRDLKSLLEEHADCRPAPVPVLPPVPALAAIPRQPAPVGLGRQPAPVGLGRPTPVGLGRPTPVGLGRLTRVDPKPMIRSALAHLYANPPDLSTAALAAALAQEPALSNLSNQDRIVVRSHREILRGVDIHALFAAAPTLPADLPVTQWYRNRQVTAEILYHAGILPAVRRNPPPSASAIAQAVVDLGTGPQTTWQHTLLAPLICRKFVASWRADTQLSAPLRVELDGQTLGLKLLIRALQLVHGDIPPEGFGDLHGALDRWRTASDPEVDALLDEIDANLRAGKW